MFPIGNCFKQKIFRFLNVFLLLYFSHIFPRQNAHMKLLIVGQLQLFSNRIKRVDQWIKVEPLTTFLSLSTNGKPNLTSPQRLKNNRLLDIYVLEIQIKLIELLSQMNLYLGLAILLLFLFFLEDLHFFRMELSFLTHL